MSRLRLHARADEESRHSRDPRKSTLTSLTSARYQTRGHRSMMAESRMRNGDKHYFVAFVRGRAGRCLPSTRFTWTARQSPPRGVRSPRAFKASAMPLRVRMPAAFDLEDNGLDVGCKLVGFLS